jgi:RNA polymerase sigma factor (sigma-70 family)
MPREFKHELLSREQEAKLVAKVKSGDIDARNKLIEHNMRLIRKIAGRYANRQTPLDDLVQQGVLGMIRALEKFEPERELRLSTYATKWIKQRIGSYVANDHMIRVPSWVIHKHEGNRCKDAMLAARRQMGPVDDVAFAFEANPAADIDDGCRYDMLRTAMGMLSDAEHDVVVSRLAGLSLREVGRKRGLCREMIRKIEVAALDRMAKLCGVDHAAESLSANGARHASRGCPDVLARHGAG